MEEAVSIRSLTIIIQINEWNMI